MSQEAMNLIQLQRELERLFSKNQLIPRVKGEFINSKEIDFTAWFDAYDIPQGFGFDLLVQMALHKRCQMSVLIGIMDKHFSNVQQTADMLLVCAQADLVDWEEGLKLFVVKYEISDDIQEEIDRFQYPLPMVVKPRKVKTNNDVGHLTTSGSIILKKNHHNEDVCLDHINRMNRIPLVINFEVAKMVKNQWRNLDKMKLGETRKDFLKRKKAFEKYDRTAMQVMELVTTYSPVFYLTHKYCKRLRTYCQGYHVNYQGAPWNKAVVEFSKQEIVT